MSETTESDDKALEYYKKYTENQNLRKYFTGSPVSYLPKIDSIEIDTENNPDLIVSTTNIDVIITHESSDSHEINNESHMSSPTCNRKLEWDSGADIGYANYRKRQNNTTNKKLFRSASLSALNELKNKKVEFKLDETSNKQTNSSDSDKVNIVVVDYSSSSDESDVSEPHNAITTSSSDTVSTANVIIASSSTRSSNSGVTHMDKKVSNFAVTLKQLKDKIGLPDAHSTPREMFDTPRSYSSNNSNDIVKRLLAKSSSSVSSKSKCSDDDNNKERVVNLCLTKPVTIECISSDCAIKQTKPASIQTELSEDVKLVKSKLPLVKPKRNQDVLYCQHNRDTVSTSQTDSNEVVNCDDTFEYQQGNGNTKTREEIEISKSVELIKRLVKSKKYDASTKKRYIKKIVQKISEGHYQENSSSSSELFQPRKQRTLDIKTFTENIVPQIDKSSTSSTSGLAEYSNWREDKTSSEKLLESRLNSNNNNGDCLLNFAENERKYQLTWINSEITHLSKLRNLLTTNEPKPSGEIKKLTSIYKVQHSSEDNPLSRKYVIETEIGTSRPLSDNINFNLDGKTYNVISQPKNLPPTVSGDIKVSYSDTSTHIRVSAHCKLCNSFPCCCVCLQCCRTPCVCREIDPCEWKQTQTATVEHADIQIGTSRGLLKPINVVTEVAPDLASKTTQFDAKINKGINVEQQFSRTGLYRDVHTQPQDVLRNTKDAEAQCRRTTQTKEVGNDVRPTTTASEGVLTDIPKDLKDFGQQFSRTSTSKAVSTSTIPEATLKNRGQQFSNTNLSKDVATAVEVVNSKDLGSVGQQTSETNVCTDATCEYSPIMASETVQTAKASKNAEQQFSNTVISEGFQSVPSKDFRESEQQFSYTGITRGVYTDLRPSVASEQIQVEADPKVRTKETEQQCSNNGIAKAVATDVRSLVTEGNQFSSKDSESDSDKTNSLKRVFENCSCTTKTRCECNFVQKLLNHFKVEETLRRRIENAAVQAQNNEAQTNRLNKDYKIFSGQSLEHITRGNNTDNFVSQKSGTQTDDIDVVNIATQVLLKTHQNTQTRFGNGTRNFAAQTSFSVNESIQTSARNADTTNRQKRSHRSRSDPEASDSSSGKATCCKCKLVEAVDSGNDQKRTVIAKGIATAGVSRSDMKFRNGLDDLEQLQTLAAVPGSSNGTFVSTPTSYESDSEGKTSVIVCICCKSTVNFDSKVQLLSSGNQSYSLCSICADQRPILTAISSYTSADYKCTCYKQFCTCTNANTSSYCVHCQNKLRRTALKRGGIAYSLRLDSAPLSEFQRNVNRKPVNDLEEIRIKVPDNGRRRKKTDKDKENYHKRSSQNGRDEGKSKKESYTLQEYLKKNRPEFVDAAEHRRNAVNSSRNHREENRDELKLKFLENNLRKEAEQNKIIFTEKEMKEITKRHYKKLPEVQRRLIEQRQERLRNADKLLKNIFAKKIQRSVLKGERNFRIDTKIVTLPV